MVYIEIAIVIALTFVNGALAMSELAIVSSRHSRLKTMIARDVYGSRRALALASDPGRFLSTVQIGITLVGILSGAFSGATLGLRLTGVLQNLGVPNVIADSLGVGLVVLVITYLSLILGELVPKQVALRDPERVACRVAPAMTVLSKISAPLVTLLDFSGRTVLRLLGQGERGQSRVSDEEIQSLMAEAESAGVIEAGERKLISGVMRLADRSVRGAMTPRHEVEWIDCNADDETVRGILNSTSRAILPAGENIDDIHGVVRIRDMLRAALAGEDLSVRRFVKTAPVVIDTMDSLDVLPVLRDAAIPLALVHDEYGHFEGIVTPANLMEVIIGAGQASHDEPSAVRLGPERWSLAGSLAADEMAELLSIALPRDRGYQTAAGFLLARFQAIPQIGDAIAAHGWRFEIADLDGRRIDRIIATRVVTANRRQKL
ncbi:hemolysin family protein [Undibacter mobilis]|uniref:HlyC/CorC family transporter n=1 Tax=Undibacter mobilis TaxID=2292256 RepID=A0A371B0L4_9BRAD|nr:hemolysin family protein [Undibacter mobilis]RDV01115.1 HlyC/CorC family transporter [Undibacter mobilis]